MKNNFVIVPARGGSKGIKNKNLQKVFGKSLVIRSINHAKLILPDNQIILSTDSTKIMNEVATYFKFIFKLPKKNSISNFGPFLIHFRSSRLAGDRSLISDTLFDIRSNLLQLNQKIDKICLLQPTSPFRSTKELLKVRSLMLKSGGKRISKLSVVKVEDNHPSRMYKLDGRHNLIRLSGYSKYKHARRQDLPTIYIRDGGFYVIGEQLIKNKIQYSDSPTPIIREFPNSLNIDSKLDLITVSAIELENMLIDDPNENIR